MGFNSSLPQLVWDLKALLLLLLCSTHASILMASYFENTGRITLLAEGCRGSLSEVSMCNASFIFLLFNNLGLIIFQKIIRNHKLRERGQGQHQTYALGIKEVF